MKKHENEEPIELNTGNEEEFVLDGDVAVPVEGLGEIPDEDEAEEESEAEAESEAEPEEAAEEASEAL